MSIGKKKSKKESQRKTLTDQFIFVNIFLKGEIEMSDNITYTFEMDTKTHAKLKDLAESEHRTIAGQLRLILEEYLEKQK